jgi:hypothetical protein
MRRGYAGPFGAVVIPIVRSWNRCPERATGPDAVARGWRRIKMLDRAYGDRPGSEQRCA